MKIPIPCFLSLILFLQVPTALVPTQHNSATAAAASSGNSSQIPAPHSLIQPNKTGIQYNASATVLTNGTIYLNFTAVNITEKPQQSFAEEDQQSIGNSALVRKIVVDVGALWLLLITCGVLVGLIAFCRQYQLTHMSASDRWREQYLDQLQGTPIIITAAPSLHEQWPRHNASNLSWLR